MTRHIAKRRSAVAAALVLTGALVAGCGGDDGGGASPEDGPVSVTMTDTPGMPQFFAEFGVSKGFYEDEGLDLEVTTLPGGSQQATAAMAGETEFIGGDVVTFNTLVERDLPLRIIRPGTSAAATPEEDFSTVQVAADSPVQTPADLAGATIAVNELNNIGTISIRGALEKEGVDPESVDFAEIPFPDMLAALESGSVDAAWVIEPFSTIGQQQGNRAITAPYATYAPSMQIGLVLCTQQYAEENPEVVEAFQAAHTRTAEYITENPDEFRQALVDIGGFDPAVAEAIKLPAWNPTLNPDTLEQVAESMVDAGLLDQVPDYEGFVHDDA